MQTVILLIVAFLYNGEVKTASVAAPSAKECLEVRDAVVADVTKDSRVRYASAFCVRVEGGDKS